jgi:hypothetical protein
MLDFPDRGTPFRMMICPSSWVCAIFAPRAPHTDTKPPNCHVAAGQIETCLSSEMTPCYRSGKGAERGGTGDD